jgi:hypothetical protein
MANEFREHPHAGAVFCNVTCEPYDSSAGYVPVFDCGTSRTVRTVPATAGAIVMGAGMALRRDAVKAIGGFDTTMGPGGRFASCDDWDIEVRLLMRGWEVRETADVAVVHHGFRSSAEGREHVRRDWIAIGSVPAKLVRAGHPTGVLLAVRQFAPALRTVLDDAFHLRRPRVQRIISFVHGFALGLMTPVDRRRLCYRPRQPAARAGRPSS